MAIGLAPAAISRLRFPAWQRAYEATLQPTDTSSLFKLVEIAEATLLIRRDHVKGKLRYKAEQRAIHAALGNLAGIKKEKLKFVSYLEPRKKRLTE